VRAPDTRQRPQVEDFRELLAAMGVPPPASWVPRLELSEELLRGGRERLLRAHIAPEDGPLVALFPGAEFGSAKRWPWRRFAELARALRREVPGCRVVIIAGPAEVWLAVRVHEESGHVPPVIGPDLDLAGLAGVLAYCDAMVTNDSGPMHLAAALEVPCVALFGPTDARRTAPAGDGHAVLRRDLWCQPCFRRSCPLLHHRCMRDLAVEDALAACRETLARALPVAGT
jgi:heptosyltransferase-2